MKKLLIAVLVIATVSYLIISNISSDIQINKYDNKQAVIEQKAIELGYIPLIIPNSAYDIAEMHNESKQEIFGAFSYKESDEHEILLHLTDTGDTNHTMVWKGFLFHIDKEKNRVKYRNKIQ